MQEGVSTQLGQRCISTAILIESCVEPPTQLASPMVHGAIEFLNVSENFHLSF